MATPYIPAQDQALDAWAANFAALITTNPALYGTDAIAAASIQAARDLYHGAYLLGGLTAPPNPQPVNPSTRTPVTVAAKDTAKLAGRLLWRSYAAQIRLNPGVMPSDKIALGLNLPNNSPSQIPAPVTWPILQFISAGPLTHVLTYVDSMAGVGKAKPAGAVAALLFATPAVAVETNPENLAYNSSQTKSPLQVQWPPPDAGKIASYAARWVTRTGLEGPWGPITSATIVGA